MWFTVLKLAAVTGLLAVPARDPATDAFGDPLPPGAVLRLGTTRLRHADLSSLAFTADGKVVSFGRDYVVRVWDPATGRQIGGRAFRRIDGRVGLAGFLSADAGRLAIPLDDGVRVFDVATGRELAVVVTDTRPTVSARFSPDGKVLALIDSDGTLRVCDVEAKAASELARFESAGVPDLAFSRDGTRLAVGHPTAGAVVFAVADGRELLRYEPSEHPAVAAVSFDPTGDVLAVFRIVPAPALDFVRVSTGKTADGWSCPPLADAEWARFTPDDSAVVLGGPGGLAWVDPKSGRVARTADGPACSRPAWSADGRLVASGGQSVIRVWDAASGRPVTPAAVDAAPAADVHGLAVSADGRTVVTKGTDGLVRAWGADGTLKATVRAEPWGGGIISVGPDGRDVYAISTDHRAVVRWDLAGREVARFLAADLSATYVSIKRVRLSADGGRLAIIAEVHRAGDEATVATIWDTAKPNRLSVRRLAGVPAEERVAVSPDLEWCFFDGRAVSLTGLAELSVALPDGWIARQAVVSPDGRLVAWVVSSVHQAGSRTIADPKGIWVHETATGRRLLDLPRWDAWKLQFTPDSRGLVVADELGLSRWDLATGTAVVRRPAPRRFSDPLGNPFASSLAVFPDGNRVVTGHIDTTALVWDLTPPARRAKVMSEHELTAAWADLAGEDAAKAYAAVWALADAPEAVAFLKARVRPVAALNEETVRKLIDRLDAPAFASREAAEKELRRLGDSAAPVLKALQKSTLSAEQARRVERVLDAVTTPVLPAGEKLRQVRAVAALELIGTAESRALLAELARGAAGDRVTRDAAGAVRRFRSITPPLEAQSTVSR